METNKPNFAIMGRYKGRTEEIDEFETEKDAQREVIEYRIAFGPEWSLWIVDHLSIKLF